MSNEELAKAIAEAFHMTRHVGNLHESYKEVHKHYQALLEIQQKRASLAIAPVI